MFDDRPHQDFRPSPQVKRVLLVGATGTIGSATADALVAAGHRVVCFVRSENPAADRQRTIRFARATVRFGDVTDPASIERDAFCEERFDAVISCLSSRTGAPADAQAIDRLAQRHVLHAALAHGVSHFVSLSAICVQRPRLAFQLAKLAFEDELMASGMRYSIVRPTAYFKSLSGQIDRVRSGKPFMVFGDGTLTACKPISDRDLARYLVECLTDRQRHNRVLPIGGPGPAITPREQGEKLFSLLNKPPKFQRIPPWLFLTLSRVFDGLGAVLPSLKNRAEFLRIAHYYATESMLVFDQDRGAYDAEATPSYGSETLWDFYQQALNDKIDVDLKEHAMF